MNAKHTTASTPFFTKPYFISCLVLATLGLMLLVKFSPAKAKPEELTITSDKWICIDTRPAGLHAECTNLVLRVGK
jgi:hypothetical protein